MQQDGSRKDLGIAAFTRLDLQRILEDAVDMGEVMRTVVAFCRVGKQIGGERLVGGKISGGEKGGQVSVPVSAGRI